MRPAIYITDEEDQAMQAVFWEFDRNVIHERYKSVLEGLRKRKWIPDKTFSNKLSAEP